MTNTQQDTEWLTRAQTAETLGMNVATVDRWAALGILTRYRQGVAAVRYARAEVEALALPRPSGVPPLVALLHRVAERSELTPEDADALVAAERVLARLAM